MALSDDERRIIAELSLRHDAEIPGLEELDRYYEGTQSLTYMQPEILRQVEDRIRPVVIAWPQMVVDSVEERLRLEGFKTGDKGIDKEILRVWKTNEMILGFRQAVVDALVMRRAAVCVGTNEDDAETPIVTPESPLEVYPDVDPRTRRTRAALRRVNDIDPMGGVSARYATLYLPNETIWCKGLGNGGWIEQNRDKHNLGQVPVVPLVNRARLRSSTRTATNMAVERLGRSDIEPIIPLSNAANKIATDMVIAAEFVAVPLRALFGIGPAGFRDAAGNQTTALTAMMGKAITIEDDEVSAFEFAAAQLQNFTTALRELAQLVASISGLPPHYLGMSSDNPASAEAIAGAEARLATRAERKQDSFGVAAVRVARLIRRFQTKTWDPALATMTPDWRDVRTPTISAMADAAQKLYTTTPKPIVPLRQTREKLGYSDEEIDLMEDEDELEAQRSPTAALVRGLGDRRTADAVPA